MMIFFVQSAAMQGPIMIARQVSVLELSQMIFALLDVIARMILIALNPPALQVTCFVQ